MTGSREIIIAGGILRCFGADRIDLSASPDGPLLIRGATRLVDDQGAAHQIQRPVVAVCRCGGSTRAPWCDGMHKLINARDRERGEQASSPPAA